MNVTFIETKNGKGFKLCVDGTWLYTSKTELFKAIGKGHGCIFRTIEDKPKQEQIIA